MVVPYLRQAAASRQPVTHEHTVTSRTGQDYVMRLTYVPHLDQHGKLQGFVALILGITEQRRVEEALRVQEQRLELIMDSIPAYVVYTDAYWNILHANRAYAGFWGRSKDDLVGKNVQEIASPAAYQELKHYLEQVEATRQVVSYESKVASAAGQTYLMRRSYVPYLDEQGNVGGVVALILDVTAQRQAEEALRATEERYRIVIENMRDGVAMVDETGTLTFVNDRLCQMTGRTREEMIGQSSAVLFFEAELKRRVDQLARRKLGLSDTYTSVFVRKDGTQVPVRISASPITSSEGQYKGGFAVVTDMTAQKRAEQALLEAKEAAEGAKAAAETARLEEQKRRFESERRRRLAEGLADVLAALNAKRPLDDVLNLVVRRARQLLGAQAAAIYGVEGAEGTLRIHATQGLVGALFSEMSSDIIRGLVQQAIAERRPFGTFALPSEAGPRSHPDRHPDTDSRRSPAEPPGSFLAAPILLQDLVYGALVIYFSGPRAITTEDWELVSLMAAQAELAVENTRLRAEVEQTAVAAERNRLARELHDSVTQALFSASLISETLPRVWERHPDEGRRGLNELHRLTHGALAEMRTLLLELRPGSLMAQPLDSLLTQLADAIPARTRIPVLTSVVGDCTAPEDVKLALYRIAQEALNNVVKHAHASQVLISLRGDPERLTLTIQDDGRGFDPEAVKAHQLGLGIMRERARGVAAHLLVDSHPGAGTTVAVSWSSLWEQA
jgi:PAS domain S-box-containing protein